MTSSNVSLMLSRSSRRENKDGDVLCRKHQFVFPGSASSANQAFCTLSRMLHIAVDWSELRVAPQIELRKELGRTAKSNPELETLLLSSAPQPLYDLLVWSPIPECVQRR